MRKIRAFLTCALVAGLLAAGAASATTPHYYPRARVLCAQRISPEIRKIMALSRNPAIAATALGLKMARKVKALFSIDNRACVSTFHRIAHNRRFRRSQAATREVCLLSRSYRADAHILEDAIQIGRTAL